MKSTRINLLMTSAEKTMLDARARAAGVSTGELVRRAISAYDASVDMDELRALADELARAADRMDAKLAATLAKMAQLEDALADKDALRAATRAELQATGTTWPFGPIEAEVSVAGSA